MSANRQSDSMIGTQVPMDLGPDGDLGLMVHQRYLGLEWRLDAVVASRTMHSPSQVTPQIILKVKTSHSNQILQTDVQTLCRITDVLESALRDAKSTNKLRQIVVKESK